jgi:hypothetical protein
MPKVRVPELALVGQRGRRSWVFRCGWRDGRQRRLSRRSSRARFIPVGERILNVGVAQLGEGDLLGLRGLGFNSIQAGGTARRCVMPHSAGRPEQVGSDRSARMPS